MGVVLLALMSGAVGDARAQVASEKARANDERVGETASSEGRPSLGTSDSDALGEPVRVTSGLMRRPVYDGIGRKAAALRRALQRRAVAQGADGQEAPEVGDERHFETRNVLDQSQWRTVRARLVYRSAQVQLWLSVQEREALADEGVLDAALDSLVLRLEEQTPGGSLDAEKGILPLAREHLGRAPDVDGDGRLDVLLLDIRDRFEQTGAYVAGFFDPRDLTQKEHSNRRDLLYVDTRPTLVYESRMRVAEAAATMAHEYQHLIHARYEGERPGRTFVNEGLSEVTEILFGFPPRPASAYFRQPGRALLSWNYADPLPDYARASLFAHYLFERIGFEHVSALVQSDETGRAALAAVLDEADGPSFETLFRDWGWALFRGAEAEHGYRHPARQALQFTDAYVFDALPQVKGVFLPPLSHAPVRFPLTEQLSLRARGETEQAEIRFSGRTAYPTGAGRFVESLGAAPAQFRAEARPHGSIDVLASNVSPRSAKPDSERTGVASLLAEGARSGRRRVLSYDDGAADPYSGSASYLLLDGPEEAMALTFGPEATSWLYGAAVKALFLSEVEDSGVPLSAPREATLRVRRLTDDGRPGAPLTPPVTRTLRRPFGNPKMTLVSLREHYDTLAALQDSFVVTLRSAGEENPLAVALDRTAEVERAGAGSAFYATGSRSWRPIAEVRAEGASLAGYRPMLRAHSAAQQEAAPDGLQAEIERDLEQVYVRLRAPFALDEEKARLSARLPSGRLVDGRRRKAGERGPFSGSDTTGAVFALPLEAGGGYELHARAEAQGDALMTMRSTFTWEPSVAKGFELSGSYPNPVRAGRPARVRLLLLEDAEVSAALYDARGRRVGYLAQGRSLSQGPHRLRLDVGRLSSGVYFARVRVRRARDGQTHAKTRKLVVVR
jgi:hypothetical protein